MNKLVVQIYRKLYIRNMELNSRLDTVIDKVIKLKSRSERLEKENHSLRESIFEYLKQIEKLQVRITDLQTQLQQQTSHNTTPVNAKEIEQYIRLLDQCIEQVQEKMQSV